jgi:hypothetical protein
MLIICDKDSEPPYVPEIVSMTDFRDFVISDFPRLKKHEISKATYVCYPFSAELIAKNVGETGVCFHVEMSVAM